MRPDTEVSQTSDLGALAGSHHLDDLRRRLDPLDFMAGWNKHEPSLWKEPRTDYQPMVWRWAAAKAGLDAAGRLIDAEQAERRNLFMVNPIEGNHYATLRTLVSAYQMLLPGEKARSHRHATHAMRVILDAHGAYSVVNGHKHPMETGDIVLTPGGSWHGHGHEGDAQAHWFDCLDLPLTRRLETVFFEEHPLGFEPITQTAPESPYRYSWASTQDKQFGSLGIVAHNHVVRNLILFEFCKPSIGPVFGCKRSNLNHKLSISRSPHFTASGYIFTNNN